jgi:hypothetical protein
VAKDFATEHDPKYDKPLFDPFKFGEYDEAVYRHMKVRVECQQQRVSDMISELSCNPKNQLSYVCGNKVQDIIDLIQPEIANSCFFKAKQISGPFRLCWQRFSTVSYYVRSCLISTGYVFRRVVQQYLWIFIMMAYTIGKTYTNTISESYILQNPRDLQAQFTFKATLIYNCSLVPEGQPIMLFYSHKMLDYYGIITYGISIALVIQNISQQQANLYDWITVDEVMGEEKEIRLFGMNVIVRCEQKMTASQCHAIYLDSLHNKIIRHLIKGTVPAATATV